MTSTWPITMTMTIPEANVHTIDVVTCVHLSDRYFRGAEDAGRLYRDTLTRRFSYLVKSEHHRGVRLLAPDEVSGDDSAPAPALNF